MATRAETPEDWSTRSLSRAARLISSTSSRTSSGITTLGTSRSVHASWRVMSAAIFTSGG